MNLFFSHFLHSGATRGCVWHMGLVQRAWTEAGDCGRPGRSAAGHVEVESPLLSDTVTAPGTGLSWISVVVGVTLLINAKADFKPH